MLTRLSLYISFSGRKSFLLLTFILLVCFNTSASLLAEVSDNGKASLSNDPLARLVRLVSENPDEFSYMKMSLEVAREIYPDLNDEQIARLDKGLNQKGDALKKKLEGAQGGKEIVRRINKYIYNELGLRPVRYYEPEEEDPDYFFPHAVLKNKQGTCLGLSLVYLSLCERAQVPVFPIHSLQHIYVRYDDGKELINIETTEDGKVFKEKDLIKRQKLRMEQLPKLKNIYFCPVDKLKVLGDLLNALSWCSAINTAKRPLPPDRAVLAGKLCVELGEGNFSNWDTLAQAYKYAKQPVLALEALKKSIELRPSPDRPFGKKYWKDRLRRFTEAAY